MARKALAWLAVLGLVAPAGAQEVLGGDDLPDNMDEFRRTPLTDDVPITDEEAGVGGSGTAGTGDGARQGELHGEVVSVRGAQLWLREGGAVFPIELTQETRFTPDRSQALQPGQEVRARFTLEGDGYVVNALEPTGQVPVEKQPGER
ncbi:hypothetical protein ATI61_106290 [Archangium gephyra]|uniref:DUF5666 domain-containing protein n=1 Tax=Archangium gephyra TaxID=48 RepID=A0AAC8TAK1_9BACT|nr:hypothetical protein [Archangium gephyra]AKI98906.1 Hypothetical protein AA314_00533 [Archangium gephyra]REG30820.1 hypothetical protein ATI61_106290 [Archangium gephyra]